MGTYISDKTEVNFDKNSLIDKVDDGYEIRMRSFKLQTENPYQPYISEGHNGDIFISYLYYGNDSYYERRRQEYRKNLSLKEIHLAIINIFPDEKRIATGIKKENGNIVKICYSTADEIYSLDIVDKDKLLLDNISFLYEILSKKEGTINNLKSELINSRMEIEKTKLYVKEKCQSILDVIDK
ncbi:hypothetical protein ACIPUG_05780 [Pectobacterium sp. CHL-2024]|uniref:hypothetical protein n=1 Tax=Pectobacterium sp. CHL-2024 TaxID=3377079 RepID=UPI0037F317D6